MDSDLPAGLWVESQCANLSARGIFHCILHKGNYGSGVVMVKIRKSAEQCALLIQQRDMDGTMGWMHATGKETLAEKQADSYIAQQTDFDPDLWAIEIEQDTLQNPFEGKILS